MIKKILLFLLCLLPWFFTSILPLNYEYYDKIKKPFFAPPSIFYPIAWTIIYILIAITIYSVLSTKRLKDLPKSYLITLIINYLFNQSYTIFFFGLKSAFLGFISCLGTLLSTLFLYEELQIIKSKISKLLIPYIGLSIFASILSLSIFLLNKV